MVNYLVATPVKFLLLWLCFAVFTVLAQTDSDRERRLAELERKIGQLTMENDFLKKALQHFREHHPPVVVSGGDACLKKSSRRRRKAKL